MEPSQIIHALTNSKRLPVEAIRAAGANRAAMVPIFIGEIERYLAGAADDQSESNLLLFIFHMLGSWREKSAYRVLVRLLRDPDIYDVLGDAVTETSHQILAAVFDGDPYPLYELILDEGADQYVRAQMCLTVAMVAHFGDLARAEAARFLRACYDDLKPTHDCFVWDGWQSAVAILGLVELKDLVKQAFEREWVHPSWLRFEDFEEDLAYAIANPDLPPCINGADLTLFGDMIERLSQWHGFGAQRERSAPRLETQHVPAVHHFKKTGRNEPCPCGSGKKFKKCCLDRVRDEIAMPIEATLARQL
jgi:hypothetical protein